MASNIKDMEEVLLPQLDKSIEDTYQGHYMNRAYRKRCFHLRHDCHVRNDKEHL